MPVVVRGDQMTDGSGEFQYDVFVSYSHRNRQWVRTWLVPKLRDEGLTVCVDHDCFDPGAPALTEMERAVVESRKTVLVLSAPYIESEWCEFENVLAQTLDPAARRRRVIPIIWQKCEIPLRINTLIYVDFRSRSDRETQLQRLVTALHDQPAAGPARSVPGDSGLLPYPPQPHFAHPYPMQENFTGRVSERSMLTEWLSGGERSVMAMVAIGGMGKSALAWAWLQRDLRTRTASRVSLDRRCRCSRLRRGSMRCAARSKAWPPAW